MALRFPRFSQGLAQDPTTRRIWFGIATAHDFESHDDITEERPMLRASGIQWDLRKVENYECYGEFDWDVQWQKEGDSLARYLVRIGEMVESIKIIQQALEGIPGGPYENLEIRYFDREREPEWNDFEYRFISKKPSPTFELPKQELYKSPDSKRTNSNLIEKDLSDSRRMGWGQKD
ncbi:hypothetical protein Ahy_A09g045488 [Arachis hypogaea]|uniref:NADH-quinone oxidoreductase subunit D domain-containing protein n=1 Tax=Arachis hypogaea TaxID=3818 RepID=A0A445BME2_ARAHY|nr:hypothetical protein Ahy_A09g045488 [Arachis hypogaea]